MNKLPKRKFGALLSLAATSALVAVHAQGQTTAPGEAASTQNPQVLEKVVVTGSYIPAAADEAKALPVQIIDVSAIQASGVQTNVLDVLRKTVPQIQGGNNIGVENANISGAYTNGGSQVALRNTSTLVLIDGKRVAPSAVAASGSAGTGIEFVDLNLIPLSAVERVEVLTDGASAIYGTDAVSGVVNIILKKDYTGAEVDFHMSMAPKDTGGYMRSRSIAAVAGGGDAKTHLMFAAEWTKSQPLWERDVAYDNPYYGTATYPGIINTRSAYYQLKPGLNAPPPGPNTIDQLVAQGVYTEVDDPTLGFNLSEKPTILNAVDKRIANVSGTHEITKNIQLKGDFIYAFTETRYELNPQPVSTSNDTLISLGLSPISDPGVTVRNRFIYGPNRIYDNQSQFYRATVELDGQVNPYFNWQVYANYNISYQTAYGYNQILNSALQNAIKSGLINMFAIQQDPAKLAEANIFGTSVGNYVSQLYTYDALANGEIFELPAGAVQYAAGAEYRKEALDASADYNSTIPLGGTTSLWNNGTSLAPFKNERNVKSEFAELKVPVFSPQNGLVGLHLLTLDGAVRHEEYSDGNKTTVPKISVRYLPFNDELALRATYAKSFAAPTLYDLYGPSTSGFTQSPAALDAYNSAGQPTGGKFPKFQAFQLNGFNPHLAPSKAKSYTAGVVYSPKWARGLELTVDYFNVEERDLIGAPGGTLTIMQSVERYGTASPFAQYLALGNFPGQGGHPVTAPGQVSANLSDVYVLQTLVNVANQNQHGWDINFKYTLPWEQFGRIVLNSNWAILNQFFFKSGPTDEGTDYSGTNGYGTLPKTRSYSTLDWDYQMWGGTLAWSHINGVDNLYGGKVNPYNTFDAQFRVKLDKWSSVLRGMEFDIGCNNFTNQKPPLDRDTFASPPFDASAYSFFGRTYYADLRIKF